MHGAWSLVIFTLLGQASAGMLMLSPFSGRAADRNRTRAWVAAVLLGLGALVSLGHLSDPLVSYYTIANVGTSWLSREILFVGLFGVSLLIWLVTLNAWARWTASFLGLGLVYVMSRVYIIPTVPFWNSMITFGVFLSTSLLLGSAIILFIEGTEARRDPERLGGVLLGWYPVLVALAFSFQMLVLPLELMLAQKPVSASLLAWHLVLLLAGGALGPLLLVRNGFRATLGPVRHVCPCPFSVRAGIILLFLAAGEIFGRILFYQGYTWFGM